MTTFGPRKRPRQTLPRPNSWFPLFLTILLFLYWLFARNLERVDLRPILEPWWQLWMPFFELPQVVVVLTEMLHPRVLRHLISIGIGWYLAQRAALSLVQVLYDLPDRRAARSLLSRLMARTPPVGKPVAVRGKTLAEQREKSELLRVGGPGRIAIANGEVAVTELNGRFHRILGPGPQLLDRLEYVHTILDLRPQERQAKDVPLLTQDGIEVQADITVVFRLDTGDEIATKSNPYPYDEESVRRLAYTETILPNKKISGWDNAPLGNVRSNLTQIIAQYRLDDLLHTRSAVDPFLAIRNELLQKTRPALANQGIELIDLRIGHLDLPDDVTNLYIEYWKTHWETQVTLQQADGAAMSLQEIEIARAEAEMTMIQAIIQGVQRAKRIRNVHDMQEIVALRLVEALEKIAAQSITDMPLSSNIMPTLQAIQNQLQSNITPSKPSEASIT